MQTPQGGSVGKKDRAEESTPRLSRVEREGEENETPLAEASRKGGLRRAEACKKKNVYLVEKRSENQAAVPGKRRNDNSFQKKEGAQSAFIHQKGIYLGGPSD